MNSMHLLKKLSLAMACLALPLSNLHAKEDNPNLSFSKFSEALKKGRDAAKMKFVDSIEDPWPDALRLAPERRQPSELSRVSQSIQIQVTKYQDSVEAQKQQAAKAEAPVEAKTTPKKTEKTSSKSNAKPSLKTEKGRKLTERIDKLPEKQTPSPKAPEQAKKIPVFEKDLKENQKPTPTKSAETPEKESKTESKASLDFEVIKEGQNKKLKPKDAPSRVQENKSEPTKIKHLKLQ